MRGPGEGSGDGEKQRAAGAATDTDPVRTQGPEVTVLQSPRDSTATGARATAERRGPLGA